MWRCRGESVSPRDEEGGANLHLLLPWPGSLLHMLATCVDDTAWLGVRVLHQPTGSTIWKVWRKWGQDTHTHILVFLSLKGCNYCLLLYIRGTQIQSSRGTHEPGWPGVPHSLEEAFSAWWDWIWAPLHNSVQELQIMCYFRTDLWGCVGPPRVECWGSLCSMYKNTEEKQGKQHLFAIMWAQVLLWSQHQQRRQPELFILRVRVWHRQESVAQCKSFEGLYHYTLPFLLLISSGPMLSWITLLQIAFQRWGCGSGTLHSTIIY